MKPVRVIALIVLSLGVVLLLATAYGRVVSPYERPPGTIEPRKVLERIEASFERRGRSEAFLRDAAQAYADGIDYIWPKHRARVAFTDNWILHLMSYTDPLLNSLGLTNVDDLFRAYETVNWERALTRGFGICSQNALGLAALLRDRYDIDADVIVLDGHVVVEADEVLLDPSVGLALPYDLEEAEAREVSDGLVSRIYAERFADGQVTRNYDLEGRRASETRLAELGRHYDPAGNRRVEGPKGYRPKIYWLEHASEWLKWLIPVAMILVGGAGWYRARTTPGEAGS